MLLPPCCTGGPRSKLTKGSTNKYKTEKSHPDVARPALEDVNKFGGSAVSTVALLESRSKSDDGQHLDGEGFFPLLLKVHGDVTLDVIGTWSPSTERQKC
ncbi:hypothetical protein GDO78_013440 [Eleutherodactylus coqui]|uniref:Uncharacterized protein n=1 Tax=Eleutherodactylus coqui TaxID=57060 RepID=A0A8J6F094_ELECQ|nr:hypothetical protein GDO78_013440 [Eleutherodactylus coqui]